MDLNGVTDTTAVPPDKTNEVAGALNSVFDTAESFLKSGQKQNEGIKINAAPLFRKGSQYI